MQKLMPKQIFNAAIFCICVAVMIYNLPAVLQILGIGRENTGHYLIPNGNVLVAFDNRAIAYEAVPNGTLRRSFIGIDSSGLEFYTLGIVKSDANGVSEKTHVITAAGLGLDDRSSATYPKYAGDGDGITLSSGFINVGTTIKFYGKEYKCLSILAEQYNDISTYCQGVGYFGRWTNEGSSIGLAKPIGVRTGLPKEELEDRVVDGISTMLAFGKWDRLKPIGNSKKVTETFNDLYGRLTAGGVPLLPAAVVSVCLMARDPLEVESNIEKNLPFCWGRVENFAREEKRWADFQRKANPTIMDEQTYKSIVGFIKLR